MTQPTTPPDTVTVLRDIARMLDGYAESYDAMARQNKADPKVCMSSVAADIRQNMADYVRGKIKSARAAIQPAGDYPYDALFQAIGDSLDSTVKIAGTGFSISVKAFVESIRSKGFDIVAAAPVCTPVQAAPELTPGSPFMVNMDSMLRHAESFGNGDISTKFVRALILKHQAAVQAAPHDRQHMSHAEMLALCAPEVKQDASALPPLPEPEYDYYEIKGYDEGQMHAYVLADRAARQPSAVDLLAAVFDAWENGDDCYEEGDVDGSYMGKAFRLDDDVYAQCCDLLNRANPPRNASAYSDHDARVLKLALENLLSNSMPMPMMSAKEFNAAAVAHREATAKARAALDALAARSPVAAPTEAPDSVTYTVDGVRMSPLEYISHLHGLLKPATPESAERSAVWCDYCGVDRSKEFCPLKGGQMCQFVSTALATSSAAKGAA
jgi:hypothetical protein